MPDRDYYLSATPHMVELRKQYQAHIAAMFKLAGFQDPAARAARVFALETKMAAVHATRVESEDVHGAVTWKREELAAKAPGLDWPALLDAAGLKDAPVFIIWHPKAVPGLSALAAAEPLDAWKDWLVFHAVERASNFLPKAFVDERFSFYGKALSGIPELRPRWQRGVDYTNAALGEAVGRLYVKRYFPPETKAKVQAMVSDLVKAFGKRIDALTWMSPETKAKAKQKLDTLKVGVGYPDRWQDYSGLEIVKGDALGNAQRAESFRIPPPARQAPPAGRPRRVVDDSTDSQRRQSSASERAEFSSRHPPAAVFRSAMPTRRTTTAPWARSSAMRSATASMTRAASSMPRAGSPTGGRKKISTTSRPPARRLPHSSMPTGRFPIWR